MLHLFSHLIQWDYSVFKKDILVAFFIISLCFTTILSPAKTFSQSNNRGKIAGVVIDAQNGEPIIGANIYLDGTTIGAASDLDGNFIIFNVPKGSYTVIISVVGYAETRITNVFIQEGQTQKLEITVTSEVLTSETIVVEAKALKNNEAALLRVRQKALAVTDAISAEKISRLDAGDAGEAMKAVTGASVVDGKYVYIRGLGDRYGNTTLNGVMLPTADPNKRAVQMDLFPAGLMENITILKSFTPDRPGSFTGGLVELNTRSFPEKLIAEYTVSMSYNTKSSLIDSFLISRDNSETDWLGFDDGSRDFPKFFDTNDKIPPPVNPTTRTDSTKAFLVDSYAKSFKTSMIPKYSKTPLNQSHSFILGNQTLIFNRPLGYFLGINYKRQFEHYEGSELRIWNYIPTIIGESDQMQAEAGANYSQCQSKTDWGISFSLAYKPNEFHEIKSEIFNTQSANENIIISDGWKGNIGSEEIPSLKSRWIQFTERNTQSFQFSGKHFFSSLANLQSDWLMSFSQSTLDEPDLRVFQYALYEDNIPYLDSNEMDAPSHFIRDLKEHGNNLLVNFALSFKQWSGLNSRIKFGVAYDRSRRSYESTQYWYKWNNDRRYRDYIYPNEERFFTEGLGIIGESNGGYLFGNYLRFSGTAGASFEGVYEAEEKVPAGYAMIELPLISSLKLVGGARYESTDIRVVNGPDINGVDTAYNQLGAPYLLTIGEIKSDDWLPSINLIYTLTSAMNIRLAYTHTLSRPSFRELAPIQYKDHINGYQLSGNPDLKRGLNINYDVRWEWFPNPGELFSIGWFYKRLINPIQQTIGGNFDDPIRSYSNAEHGRLWGIEFEIRKNLDFFRFTKDFQLGLNYFYVDSRMDYPIETLRQLDQFDPNKLLDRHFPLQGQSDFTFNFDLSYVNSYSSTTFNIHHYIYGDRLDAIVGSVKVPGIYEKSRGVLSANISKKIWKGLSVKFSAKNLLDSPVEFVQNLKLDDGSEKEFVHNRYKPGRTFGIAFSYGIN